MPPTRCASARFGQAEPYRACTVTGRGSSSWSPRAPVGCHPSPKGFPWRVRNAGFPRQAGAGSPLASAPPQDASLIPWTSCISHFLREKGRLALGAGQQLGALGRGGDRGRQERAVCVMNVHVCSRGHFHDGTCVCDSRGEPSCQCATSQPWPRVCVSSSSCVAPDISAEPGSGWPEQTQNYSCSGTGGGPSASTAFGWGCGWAGAHPGQPGRARPQLISPSQEVPPTATSGVSFPSQAAQRPQEAGGTQFCDSSSTSTTSRKSPADRETLSQQAPKARPWGSSSLSSLKGGRTVLGGKGGREGLGEQRPEVKESAPW